MTITTPTLTSDFSGFLPATITGPIFERAARTSVVMSLCRRVDLGPNGQSVPVVTGRPSAGWVSEGAAKPATKGTRTLKTISPKKLAAIVVVSAETVRANPGGYVTGLRNELAEAFAIAFDRAALHDEGPDGTASGGPFSTYIAQTTKVQEIGGTSVANGGIFVDLKEAMSDIVSDVDATGRRYRLTGWAIDSVLEPAFWGAVDTTGRPIWVDLPTDAANGFLGEGAGRLLGRNAYLGEGVASANFTDVVGFGGDWTQAVWGQIGGISYDVSTQATVTIDGELVSLWENNLVAIRAETEMGFLVNDADAFTKLTNTNNTPVSSS